MWKKEEKRKEKLTSASQTQTIFMRGMCLLYSPGCCGLLLEPEHKGQQEEAGQSPLQCTQSEVSEENTNMYNIPVMKCILMYINVHDILK